MPHVLTLAEAREAVKAQAAPTVTPALTDGDIEAILTRTANVTVWAADTAYEWGERVIPTSRNGRYYLNKTAGTTGATEPTWATGLYTYTTDGTASWQTMTPDWEQIYNIRRAVYEAWVLKAQKASEYYAFSEDGQSFQAQQVYEHCMKMASRFMPVTVG